MLAYVIRRLMILIPTLLGVSVIVFLMLHMTPGDPAELLLGERATTESLEQMREQRTPLCAIRLISQAIVERRFRGNHLDPPEGLDRGASAVSGDH